MAEARRPAPQPDDVTRPFWEACARRVLCFQQCAACGYRWLPASVVCPRCWTPGGEWVKASGAGTVFSFAVYHRAYHPAFKPLVPYVVGVIELAEGPRLVSNIVGAAPGDIRVGMPVSLEFLDADGVVLPVFRLAGVRPAGIRQADGGA
jgi:uncharacterized OB-fold protein